MRHWVKNVFSISGIVLLITIQAGMITQKDVSSTTLAKHSKENVTMISQLHMASSMPVHSYNPAVVIETVNLLHPLGKKGALEQVRSYLDNCDKERDSYGLFWVLRTLFDVPKKTGFPMVRIGRANIPPPTDPEKLPRFPIVITRDIPFLVISEYTLSGLPESVETHIEYFEEHGKLRKKPLNPGTLTGIEDNFLHLWRAAYGNKYTAEALETVNAQISRMSSSLAPSDKH